MIKGMITAGLVGAILAVAVAQWIVENVHIVIPIGAP
jgi:hypothetical protein